MSDADLLELERLEAELATRQAAPAPDENEAASIAAREDERLRLALEELFRRQQHLDRLTTAQREQREVHQRYLTDHPYFDEN